MPRPASPPRRHRRRLEVRRHVGKKILVVYFYPASFTGGCTKQACAYRDDQKALNDAGAEVVGVSGDQVKNQEAFKKSTSSTSPARRR